MIKLKSVMAAVVASMTLMGCASFKAPSYSSDYAAVDALKSYKLQKMAVATVKPEDPEAKVNKISLRGNSLVVDGGTFSTYLHDAIVSDLTDAGLYDPRSRTRLDIEILENDIDVSGISTGTGVLAVDLKVVNNDAVVLDRKYSAYTQFDSSFAAMMAIPKGQNEYPNLVRKLLSNIYNDRRFVDALQGIK